MIKIIKSLFKKKLPEKNEYLIGSTAEGEIIHQSYAQARCHTLITYEEAWGHDSPVLEMCAKRTQQFIANKEPVLLLNLVPDYSHVSLLGALSAKAKESVHLVEVSREDLEDEKSVVSHVKQLLLSSQCVVLTHKKSDSDKDYQHIVLELQKMVVKLMDSAFTTEFKMLHKHHDAKLISRTSEVPSTLHIQVIGAVDHMLEKEVQYLAQARSAGIAFTLYAQEAELKNIHPALVANMLTVIKVEHIIMMSSKHQNKHAEKYLVRYNSYANLIRKIAA